MIHFDLFLQGPPSGLSISPQQEVYHPGDTITCTAEGNPEPSIEWTDAFNNTVEDSATLMITSAMVGTQTFACRARNTIRGETYTAEATVTISVQGVLSTLGNDF